MSPTAVFRLAGFLAITAIAWVEWVLTIWATGRASSVALRAAWQHRLAARLVKLLGIRMTREGTPPPGGLLVSNHLSYLDIITVCSQSPVVFVSKKEVRDWPWIGLLAAMGGTLFIDREQRRDVERMGTEIQRIVAQGVPVCVFPEGTSSDGSAVLPFFSSLFQPAVEHGWIVTPAHLRYGLADGSVTDEVCYWRDMSFFPHFLNLLGKSGISARVAYGEQAPAQTNRKLLCAYIYAQVCQLGGLVAK